MTNIKLDTSYSGISGSEISKFGAKVKKIYTDLEEKCKKEKESFWEKCL